MTVRLQSLSFIILAILCLSFCTVRSTSTTSENYPKFFESAAEEKQLVDLLEAKLTKHSPPAGMVNQTVFMYLSIYQIVDVDEKNGILTLKLWMYLYYKMYNALWDPALYKNTTRMQFQPDTFWKPDVVPLDAIEVKYESYNYQAVWAEGVVAAWSSMVTMKLSCSFDVTKFPFDKHYCPVKFGQWVHLTTDFKINHDTDYGQTEEAELTFYKAHEQWKLLEPVIFNDSSRTFGNYLNFSDKVLHINIERIPRFYALIFVAPVILLYILSPLVFLVPVDSGEKISMSITLLLAQMVSMGGISEVLPASSTNFPIISYFLGISLLHMGVQTLFTVIVINIHGLGGCHKVPDSISKMLCSRAMYLFMMTPCQSKVSPKHAQRDSCSTGLQKLFTKKRTSVEPETLNPGTSKNEKESPKPAKMSDLVQIVENVEKTHIEASSNEEMEVLWKLVSVFIDRILFFTNVFIIVGLCIGFNRIIHAS